MARYDLGTNHLQQRLVTLGAVVFVATSAVAGGVMQASGMLDMGTLVRGAESLGDATSLALIAMAGGAALCTAICGTLNETRAVRILAREVALVDTRYVPVQTRVMLQPSLPAKGTPRAEERVLRAA